MSHPYSETLGAPSPTAEEALADIRTLWHYLPNYDYRPDLFDYTEFHTTDPDYVVVGVDMMTPAGEHIANVRHLYVALDLLAGSCDTPIYVAQESTIYGIPGSMFAAARNTSKLAPDMTVWTGAAPARPYHHYEYGQHGVPLLVVEVVSHSSQRERRRDLEHKWLTYARMGIQEYWLLDTEQECPLIGYTLADSPQGAEYQRIEESADGSPRSHVLDNSLRWVEDSLEGWKPEWGGWVRVLDIPSLEAAREADARGREGRAEGAAEAELAACLDLLLAMGVSFDDSRELGLDLLCLDTVPGVGALMRTQGDLGQLRLHISPRPPDKTSAEDYRYVTALLRACPTYRLNDYTGPG